MQRLTSSPRLREAGLAIIRVASLGVVALLLKDRKTRVDALNQVGDLVRQFLT